MSDKNKRRCEVCNTFRSRENVNQFLMDVRKSGTLEVLHRMNVLVCSECVVIAEKSNLEAVFDYYVLSPSRKLLWTDSLVEEAKPK